MAGHSEGGCGRAKNKNKANTCICRRMEPLSPEPVKHDITFFEDQFFSSSCGNLTSQVVELVANELTSDNNTSDVLDLERGGDGLEDHHDVNIDVPPMHVMVPRAKLIRVLLMISLLTLIFDVSTALYKPAMGVLFGRSKVGYYVTLATIFVSGVAEAFVALWISRSADASQRRFAIGRAVLCASTVPLVAILGIGSCGFIKG